MGVLACDRYTCDSIMCDHYIPEVGYMCDECITEFKEYIACDHSVGLVSKLKDFMGTSKRSTYKSPYHDIDDFFDSYIVR